MVEDWASLETDVIDGEFRPATRESKGLDAKTGRFPCQACGGTGQYRGVRLHQPRGDCFACGGRGYFATSERDRKKARAQRAASKQRKLAETRSAFDEQYPDVTPTLSGMAKWSEFARDLLGKLNQYGSLSDKQVKLVRHMAEKAERRRKELDAERNAGNATVDLSRIRAMFETAVGNGYRAPIYRAAGLIITRAPDHGKNPGALYVKDETDAYLGKIVGTAYVGRPAPGLNAIAADPRGEAIKYGQRTGSCSCCGRALTNEGSITAGIGPVCASKWGL